MVFLKKICLHKPKKPSPEESHPITLTSPEILEVELAEEIGIG